MLKLFFARIVQKLLEWSLEWEIYNRIAPQIHQEKECGYPFQSEAELQSSVLDAKLEAQRQWTTLEATVAAMPRAYGIAFHYIVLRDLNRRILRFKKIAHKHKVPSEPDPRFVAVRA